MARFGVGGQWEAEIKLGGVSLALTPNTLKQLIISSSVTKPMPTCTFTVVDQGAEFLTNVGVADGMPLSIMMGDGKGGEPFVGDFRVVGGPADAHYTTKGVVFTVNGMLNKMGFLRKVTNTVKKDTSAGMISTLAREAGISKVDTDPTSDKMAWLPNGMPIAKRIAEIASRGWANPQSAMVHVLNEDGTFKYKDLSKLATASAKRQFGGMYPDAGIHGSVIPVLQFRAMSLQGLYNNAAAYGATAFVEGLSGKTGFGVGDVLSLVDSGSGGDLVDVITSALQGNFGNFSTLMTGAGLNISGDIQKAVGSIGAKQYATPLSSGNTHPQYHRAKVQNVRGRAAFGNDVVLLSNQACGLSNLDNVFYHCTNPWSGADIPMFSGDYIITAKDMIITTIGGKAGYGYFEKVTITNNGGGAQRPTS